MFYGTLRGEARGFTVIEMVVVAAIISILASIGVAQLRGARITARDTVRAHTMDQIAGALDRYRIDNGHYPTPCPGGGGEAVAHGFNYSRRDANGNCSIPLDNISYCADNSVSPPGWVFLEELYTGYIPIENYRDASDPGTCTQAVCDAQPMGNCTLAPECDFRARYNCRYIAPKGSSPDKYFIHCGVEEDANFASKNDGGTHDLSIEFASENWLCVDDVPWD